MTKAPKKGIGTKVLIGELGVTDESGGSIEKKKIKKSNIENRIAEDETKLVNSKQK